MPTDHPPTPYAIGSTEWPGLSKLAEEAGEVLQVIGKLMGTGGHPDHWDGSNLRTRLVEELADLAAAVGFVEDHNFTEGEQREFRDRVAEKQRLFNSWRE